METIHRGLEQMNPWMRDNVTLVSHSTWNEERDVVNRPGLGNNYEADNWNDIRRDFTDVTQVDIGDQNLGNNNDRGFYSSLWSWMDNSNDPLIQEARELMNAAGEFRPDSVAKQNDPSDAGMLFYVLTGDPRGNPNDVREYLRDNPIDLDGIGTGGGSPSPRPAPQPNPNPRDNDNDDRDTVSDVFEANSRGQFIMDVEDVAISSGWRSVSDYRGIEGSSAYLWTGGNRYGRSFEREEELSGTLEFNINVTDAGRYSLALGMGRTRDLGNNHVMTRRMMFLSVLMVKVSGLKCMPEVCHLNQ